MGSYMNLDQWFRRRCRLKICIILSSSGQFVQKRGTIGAIVKGHYEEQFCEINFNLDQLFKRSCLLKIFLFWSSGGLLV